MFNKNELAELGFIPKSKYKLGKAFPSDFKLPQSVPHEQWRKLPLYIKVRYSLYEVEGIHNLDS